MKIFSKYRSPDVLTSVSAKLGNINQDVFHNIREELVKDGWFFGFIKISNLHFSNI